MVDLFKIGFLTVTLLDLVDIAIVAVVIYQLYKVLRGTIASQILIGLAIVLLFSLVAQAANFKALNLLLQFVTDIWIIAFIILFQPEIRSWLLMLGKNPMARLGFREQERETSFVDDVVDACFRMSQLQHGALIVAVKSSGIRGISEKGVMMNAKVTRDLLQSIFFPRSPLHDGAAILRAGTIEAARCALPLSSTAEIGDEALGMRHRAGLGISEQADVMSIIVSEETGAISLAESGRLYQGVSRDELRKRLYGIYGEPKERTFIAAVKQFFTRKNDKPKGA
jgi:diadenylate cyclase